MDGKETDERSPKPKRGDDDSNNIMTLITNILESKGPGRQYFRLSLHDNPTSQIDPDMIVALDTRGLDFKGVGPLQDVYFSSGTDTQTRQFAMEGYLEYLKSRVIDPDLNSKMSQSVHPAQRNNAKLLLNTNDLPSIILIFGQASDHTVETYMLFSIQYSPQEALNIARQHISADIIKPGSTNLNVFNLLDFSDDGH